MAAWNAASTASMPRRESTRTIARRYAALPRMSSIGRAALDVNSAARAMPAGAAGYFERTGRIIDLDDVRGGRAEDGEAEVVTAWLTEVRAGARARPVEANLTRGAEGFNGTLVVALGSGS